MEAWRKAWREGIAPQLTRSHLAAIEAACTTDDARLLQGRTALGDSSTTGDDAVCESACIIGYARLIESPGATVEQVEEFMSLVIFRASKSLGDPRGGSYFLDWYDDSPRETVLAEMLAEVRLELARRKTQPIGG